MSIYNKGIQESKNIISNTAIDAPLSYKEIAAILNDENLMIGIDKLKVSFPVENINPDPDTWKSLQHDLVAPRPESVTGLSSFPLGHAWVSVGFSTHHGQRGWVEFNPSKIINKNGDLVSLDRAIETFYDSLGLTKEYFSIIDAYSDGKILRIDLTVDLWPVSDMQALLELAKKAKPIRNSKPITYENPTNSALESVTFRSENSTVLFYDKSTQQKRGNEILRVEVQAKRPDLHNFGPSTIADITNYPIRTLFRHRVQGFIDLCSITPTSCLDEISKSKTDLNNLVLFAGHEYIAKHGRTIPQTKHHVRLARKFKKRFPHRSIIDLL